ncbi:hypothetical protein NQ317_012413 [Molorchus minor]|uniref:C2H2-type domain-containing protein n=1 Tax=Molorchus minor TaxID=1323400 RepID=A0ABQ9JFR4_9CUCU|nr:hypothetical protein NQ317_012413 [Molorchus minor]
MQDIAEKICKGQMDNKAIVRKMNTYLFIHFNPNLIIDTPLATSNLFNESLSAEEGTWTIQVIYPDGEAPDSDFLTGGEEALMPVEKNSTNVEIAGNYESIASDKTHDGIGEKTIVVTKTNDKNEEILSLGYVCSQCDKVYNARRNLVRHIKLECGKDPKYSCTYCDYKNHRRNEITKHLKKKHGKYAKY